MTTGLDHIILGVDDLDRGVAWVEQLTGVRAVFGGVHPGRGTRNAMLALGPDCYMEIMAPDPQQSSLAWFLQLPTLREPRMIAWAVHTGDLNASVQAAASAGLLVDGPHEGARSQPNGQIRKWKLFQLRDHRGGLLPFFIEWSPDSIHPSQKAPQGCHLASFHLESPEAAEMARICQALNIQVEVEPAKKPCVRARLASPKGDVELTS